jgi:hypothetical protein
MSKYLMQLLLIESSLPDRPLMITLFAIQQAGYQKKLSTQGV